MTALTGDAKYGIMTLSVGDESLFLSDFRKETDRYANLSADKIKRGKWYTENGGEPRWELACGVMENSIKRHTSQASYSGTRASNR